MGTRVFLDTNVLAYLFDASEPTKRDRAIALLADDALDLVVSTQVLSEFFVAVTRKVAVPLSVDQASAAVASLAELEVLPVTRNLVLDAVRTCSDHQLSYWDAMIVEAASRCGADQLMTEDLAAGSTLRGVEIVNPFDGL